MLYIKGSGTLSIPKCLQQNHIVSMWNNILHVLHPCTISTQFQVSQLLVISLYSFTKSVPNPLEIKPLPKCIYEEDVLSCIKYYKLCIRKVAEENLSFPRGNGNWHYCILYPLSLSHRNDEFYDYHRVSSATFLMQSLLNCLNWVVQVPEVVCYYIALNQITCLPLISYFT